LAQLPKEDFDLVKSGEKTKKQAYREKKRKEIEEI